MRRQQLTSPIAAQISPPEPTNPTWRHARNLWRQKTSGKCGVQGDCSNELWTKCCTSIHTTQDTATPKPVILALSPLITLVISVSPLIFWHTLKRDTLIPAMVLIHECKFPKTRQEMFKMCTKCLPSLRRWTATLSQTIVCDVSIHMHTQIEVYA